MNFGLLLPILTPLFTAAFCLLLWNRPRLQRLLSVAGGAGLLVSSLWLFGSVTTSGIQVVQPGDWPAPFGIRMGRFLV